MYFRNSQRSWFAWNELVDIAEQRSKSIHERCWLIFYDVLYQCHKNASDLYIYIFLFYTPPHREDWRGGGGGILDWNHLVFVLLTSSCFFWLHAGHVCCLCALILWMYWTLLSLCVYAKRGKLDRNETFCVGAILWYRQAIFRPRPVFMHFTGSRINTQLIWKVSDTFHWRVWCVCVCGGGGGGERG